MNKQLVRNILNILIALVWIVNGLFCKVLNLVPRHRQIVGEILYLNSDTSMWVTNLIGVSEVMMAVWILSGFQSRCNALVQMIIVASMNILEFILVPDMLLWGRFNSVFAFVFIMIIAFNEYGLKVKKHYV